MDRLVLLGLAGAVAVAIGGCGPAADRGAALGRGVAVMVRALPTPTPVPAPAVTSYMVDGWYSTFYNGCIANVGDHIAFLHCVNVLHDDIARLNLSGVEEVARLVADLDALGSCVQFLRCDWGGAGPAGLGKAVREDFAALQVLTGENAKGV